MAIIISVELIQINFGFSVKYFYGEHLKRKDEVYDLIMRTAKYITNFARSG